MKLRGRKRKDVVAFVADDIVLSLVSKKERDSEGGGLRERERERERAISKIVANVCPVIDMIAQINVRLVFK
jgi:hypothetical protein